MVSTGSPRRRDLQLQSFDEIRDELDRLLQGYSCCGNWTLGQNCNHLRDWMLYCVDGYPRQPMPVHLLAWVIKSTVGPRQLQKLIRSQRMPTGLPTVRGSVYPTDAADAEAIEGYKAAMDRFDAHPGEYHASPMFGAMDRQTARHLQLVHASHHLSFLLPIESGTARDTTP